MSASVVVFTLRSDLQPMRGFSTLGWVCLHWIHRFQASSPYSLFSLGSSKGRSLLEEPFWLAAAAALDRWDLRPWDEERGGGFQNQYLHQELVNKTKFSRVTLLSRAFLWPGRRRREVAGGGLGAGGPFSRRRDILSRVSGNFSKLQISLRFNSLDEGQAGWS